MKTVQELEPIIDMPEHSVGSVIDTGSLYVIGNSASCSPVGADKLGRLWAQGYMGGGLRCVFDPRSERERRSGKTPLEQLEDVTNIAVAPGNYNCNPYMLGMANGLILARAIARGDVGEVPYLSAPEKWLDDLPKSDAAPVSVPAGDSGVA